jgi:diguanylate cyclase (GGDEF)-like protein
VTLRWKLVLALMLTGLAAVMTAGGVAYWDLQRKFDSNRARLASQHFRQAVAAFWAEEGDWRPIESPRAFQAFMARRSGLPMRGAPRQGPAPWQTDEGRPTERPLLGPHANADAGRESRWDPVAPMPQAPRRGRDPGEVPYRFILTDANFRVLLGGGIHADGELLPAAARAFAQPVVVDGRTVAHVSTEGVLSASPADKLYLDAVREALLYGLGVAGALAVVLGVLLGQGLSVPLRRLTAAARSLRQGELHQRVEARGSDEVATLARAFNAMSEELVRRHDTITEQAAQLRELSLRDALTGLHNRRYLEEVLPALQAQCRRQGQPLAVVLADIDFFKRINDEHSHALGDQVLQEVARTLRQQVRAADLVVRLGGEEFVIALADTPLTEAVTLCEKIGRAVQSRPWSQVAPGLSVTLSLGLCGDDGTGREPMPVPAMLAEADQQLYRAKREGRNRVCAPGLAAQRILTEVQP